MVGAEMPCESDLIKWAEQGRLHVSYTQVGLPVGGAGNPNATFTVNDDLLTPGAYPAGVVAAKGISSTASNVVGSSLAPATIAIRVGQTVLISFNNGAGVNRGIVTAVT